MKIHTKITIFLLSIFLLADGSYSQDDNRSVCNYYSNADRIFVGKVLYDSRKQANGVADFSVNLHLKGFRSLESKIKLYTGAFDEKVKVDEEYIVFTFFESRSKKHTVLSAFPVTLLGNISSTSSENLKQPDFRIAFGDTFLVMSENHNFVKVKVIHDTKIIHPKFTESGIFVLIYPATLNFRVSVETKSSIETYILGNTRNKITEVKDGKRVTSYRVNNSPCICNYNRYQFEDSTQ